MNKSAETKYEIAEVLKNRWSPRAFDPDREIENEKLQSLFEAARWASSAFNEQPWRFIIGLKGTEEWNKILSCLAPNNQAWAKNAPLLVLSFAKKTFTHNGNVNPYSLYDVSQAVSNMIVQASHLDLYAHQMAGITKDKIVTDFNIPEDYEPVTGIVLGYLGSTDVLSEELKARELAQRSRKDFQEIVFSGNWENITEYFK
jgi:nitroreductase